MTQKRSLLRAAVVLLAVLLLSVFASAAAETAEAPQQTVFVFDQDREMDLWQQDKTLRVFCIPWARRIATSSPVKATPWCWTVRA